MTEENNPTIVRWPKIHHGYISGNRYECSTGIRIDQVICDPSLCAILPINIYSELAIQCVIKIPNEKIDDVIAALQAYKATLTETKP